MKRIYPGVVILIFVAMVLAGCGKKQEVAPSASPVVLVTEATRADVPVFSEAIATLDGSTNTLIRSQVSGYLIKQVYQEGSVVKPGDLLFEIDTKPVHAETDKARANPSAPPNAANASATAAKIDPGYVRITSPIAGVAGRAISGAGDWISPGMTLTTVSTVDPIAASFALPEKFYLDNPEQMAQASFELVQVDGTAYPQKGKFDHVERQSRTSTGMITAYALFPNPDRVLRPGQFAKIRGVAQRVNDAVSVPQRAVNELQGLNQVMVVKPDNTIEIRNVTTGSRAGSRWTITSGLKVGERVVVEGGEKCREGSPVTPQPYVAPPEEPPPTNAPASSAPSNP